MPHVHRKGCQAQGLAQCMSFFETTAVPCAPDPGSRIQEIIAGTALQASHPVSVETLGPVQVGAINGSSFSGGVSFPPLPP